MTITIDLLTLAQVAAVAALAAAELLGLMGRLGMTPSRLPKKRGEGDSNPVAPGGQTDFTARCLTTASTCNRHGKCLFT